MTLLLTIVCNDYGLYICVFISSFLLPYFTRLTMEFGTLVYTSPYLKVQDLRKLFTLWLVLNISHKARPHLQVGTSPTHSPPHLPHYTVHYFINNNKYIVSDPFRIALYNYSCSILHLVPRATIKRVVAAFTELKITRRSGLWETGTRTFRVWQNVTLLQR